MISQALKIEKVSKRKFNGERANKEIEEESQESEHWAKRLNALNDYDVAITKFSPTLSDLLLLTNGQESNESISRGVNM